MGGPGPEGPGASGEGAFLLGPHGWPGQEASRLRAGACEELARRQARDEWRWPGEPVRISLWAEGPVPSWGSRRVSRAGGTGPTGTSCQVDDHVSG